MTISVPSLKFMVGWNRDLSDAELTESANHIDHRQKD